MTFQIALRYWITDVKQVRYTSNRKDETHVDLNIEVLEIEGMLPDVDPDDGDQVQERVLVRGGGNLQGFGGGVQSLGVERPVTVRTLR